jgi:oxalate decarboxylase/phosphoglucose isomerase-like protein (cupin superfamily)
MSSKQVVVSPDQVDTIVTDWTMAKVMCGPQVTGSMGMGAVVLFFEPGQGHSRHHHEDAEQMIYVISGQGEHIIERDDGSTETVKIGAGSLIFIPKRAYHSTFNTGWEPMKVIAVFSPPGPEEYLREVGDSGGVGTSHLRIVPAGERLDRRPAPEPVTA